MGQSPLTFVGPAGALAGGILLASQVKIPLPAVYGAAAVMLAAFIWQMMRPAKYINWWLAALFFGLGMLRYGQAAIIPVNDVSFFTGRTVTVHGTVSEIPQGFRRGEKQVRLRYVLAVDSLLADGRVRTAQGKIIVGVNQAVDEPVPQIGDTVKLTGKLLAMHSYNNPGAYNRVAALNRQGIRARLNVYPGSFTVQPRNGPEGLLADLAGWKKEAGDRLLRYMPPADAAIIAGMVFGGYSGISRDVLRDFSATGIVHILSVSGSHIALVAGVILWLGGRLKLRFGLTAAGAGISIIMYAVLSGLTAPVVRSAVMGLIALIAVAVGREKDAPNALALAALAMLGYQPSLLFDVGFQLSFGSTAGLVYLYPRLVAGLGRLPRWLSGSLAVTLAAQLSVLPFLSWYFNSYSLSAFLANLVVVPVVEVVVVLSLTGLLIGNLLGPVGGLALVISSLLLGLVTDMTALLADIPAGKLDLPTVGPAGGAFYYCLLAWGFGFRPRGIPSLGDLGRKYPLGVATTAIALIWAVGVYYFRPGPAAVHFIDVGQGDAALIVSPHGRAVLIDTGGISGESGFDIGEQVVLPYLRHQGVRRLDYLFLSHGHQDHAGGAPALAALLPVENIMMPREPYSGPLAMLIHTTGGRKIIPQYEGQTIWLDGLVIRVIYAPSGSGAEHGNEVSSVIRVSYGRHSFLFTGDLEQAGEAEMLSRGLTERTTVLKVGHHGSRTSSTPAFLAAVDPQYAVISVGFNNRFGHPSPATCTRLAARGTRVYRTDQQGAIIFNSDGKYLEANPYFE